MQQPLPVQTKLKAFLHDQDFMFRYGSEMFSNIFDFHAKTFFNFLFSVNKYSIEKLYFPISFSAEKNN